MHASIRTIKKVREPSNRGSASESIFIFFIELECGIDLKVIFRIIIRGMNKADLLMQVKIKCRYGLKKFYPPKLKKEAEKEK